MKSVKPYMRLLGGGGSKGALFRERGMRFTVHRDQWKNPGSSHILVCLINNLGEASIGL